VVLAELDGERAGGVGDDGREVLTFLEHASIMRLSRVFAPRSGRT
jgi:hypothetical protein